jgi:tetratricopeptide (TPR) repeat protein
MRTVYFPALAWTGLVVSAFATRVAAQTPDHVAMGITAEQALKSDEALNHFQAALAQDSLNYEANWRAAIAAVEVAQQPASTTAPAPKASAADTADGDAAAAPQTLAQYLYAQAETYARRALSRDGTRAPGHFVVAYVLGSKSLVSDPLTRLSMAAEIWQESTEAIKRDPKHDGAYHVLGRWYAEIMRLSDFEAGYAKGELGEIAEKATWELATKNLEKAVELAPNMIYHRLDLARAYHDTQRDKDARDQLDKIDGLPVAIVQDPSYKEQAKALRASLSAAPAPAP